MASSHKRPITAEDLYQFQLLSGARISPDGKTVVYAVQRIDPKTEKKFANLWLVNTDGKTPERQFTFGDQVDNQPEWSPDGSQIAFLSNRAALEKSQQIFLIPFSGGEAHPLKKFEGSIRSISWSPDGKKLLISGRKTDAEVLERDKDEQKKKLGVVSRHYDRVFFKFDGFGYLPHERQHIWIEDVESCEIRQLTEGPIFDETSAAWSPDGQSVTFISNRHDDPDMHPDQEDLYVIPSAGGEMRKIATPVGSKDAPSFSPDGKWIAYFSQEGVGISYKNRNLWVVPSDGSAPACNLTAPYDIHAAPSTINDMGELEFMPPIWSNDSSKIFFSISLHGSAPLQSIQVDGSDLQTIIGDGGVVGSFSFDQSQQTLAYFYGKMEDPGQVWVREMASGQSRPLTHLNQNILNEIDLGQLEEVWYKGPDGNDLQGWILKPPGFDPHKKYPSILEIHGGPLTQYGNFFMHEFYDLAAGGYVVYFTNPRGGRGYGEAHAGAINAMWGDRDYADIMAWTDYVSKLPYIDPDRMGVTGGSYGGYMTVWIIGHTQRFKAAVAQRCVSNFVSMWGSSDFNWHFQHMIGAGDKAPFEDLQGYWDRSPIKYIGNAHTPTMVIHNENDHRCPIEQGEQVYVALKRLGVETEFVRFPEEFHGLSRAGRTDRRIARLNYIRGWFDRHLQAKS